MTTKYPILAVLVLAVASSTASAETANAPAKNMPQLAPLNYRAGRCTSQVEASPRRCMARYSRWLAGPTAALDAVLADWGLEEKLEILSSKS